MSPESVFPVCWSVMQKIALALGSALLAATASADPISADRPGQSSPPSVAAPGTVQLEGGFSFERETDGGDPNTNTISVPESLLRVGVLSFLEVRVSADGFVFEERAGDNNRSSGSDLTLGSRARLFDQKGVRPATGLDFNLSLPTGSDAVTSDGVDPGGTLLFEWVLNERFALYANIGLASTSLGKGDSRRAFQAEPSVLLSASISERASVFIEYYAAFIDRGVGDEHSIDGGFSWLIGDDLQLDLFAGAGLNDAAPDFFVSAGAAWRFFLPWATEKSGNSR
jgi:hypothetical protein